jgi:hypothetical protein
MIRCIDVMKVTRTVNPAMLMNTLCLPLSSSYATVHWCDEGNRHCKPSNVNEYFLPPSLKFVCYVASKSVNVKSFQAVLKTILFLVFVYKIHVSGIEIII